MARMLATRTPRLRRVRAGDALRSGHRPERGRRPACGCRRGQARRRTWSERENTRGVEYSKLDQADYAGGEFTTPPLTFDGTTLQLNIETSAIGLARVEFQDANRNPLPGFAMNDCDRIHTANSISHTVSWSGKSDVSKLTDQLVRLRFELQFGTKLYAFRVAKAD